MLTGIGIGIVIGVVGTGFVAHRWPSLFAKIDASAAVAVNAGIDKVKPTAKT